MRRLAAVIAIIAGLALVASAHGQTPGTSPTAGLTPAPAPRLTMFPYRIVLSAPHRVLLDEPITVTLDYTRVVPRGPGDIGGGFVLEYTGSQLVSVTAARGAAPYIADKRADFADLGVSGDSGELKIILQPTTGYIGEVSIGFYIRGTEISLPEGTVEYARTLVAPEGSMIITGQLPAGPGTEVTVDVLDPQTAQPVRCKPSVTGSSPVFTSAGAIASPDVSALRVIVPPSCVQHASDNLRLCWSFPQACITVLFNPGEHDIGLLPRITVVSPPPAAAGPVSPPGGVAGPDTGDGATAARADRGPFAVALVLAAMASVTLGAGVMLRRR
ncbi:MAG TPA: hypothetical protein VFY79_13875 [Dehalococcoidia bacterium]|nr:hypothetical protein [Dehalococcoidia bacterium]